MWRYLGWQTSLFVLWSTLSIILPHTLLLCYQPVLKKAPWQESHGVVGGPSYLWDRIALVLAGVTVLLSSGCCNEMPETAWLTQRTFITHSPGGWRSKGPADPVSVESLFPCVFLCHHLAVMQPVWSTKTLLVSWKYFVGCALGSGHRKFSLLTGQHFVSLYIIFTFQVLRKTLVICPVKS